MQVFRALRRLGQGLLPEGDRDVVDSMYEAICVVGALLCFFVILPSNAFQSLPAIISWLALAFGVASTLLYILARRGRMYPLAYWLVLLITVALAWFPNGGSLGSVSFYFFVLLTYAVVFFSGARRLVLLGLLASIAGGLLSAEFLVPSASHAFPTDADRLLDTATGLLAAGIASALIVWVVHTGYQRERRRLKDALASLAESEGMLTSLIDSTDDVVWLVDATEFRLTSFNKAFASTVRQSLGVEPRRGMPLDAFLPEDLLPQWIGFYRRALDEGPFTVEYMPRGLSRVYLHSFNVVKPLGTAIGVAVFSKDITERKREEAARSRLEAQLFQSQKMESLGTLAGGVAHDFNNMLAGIMGYADLLLQDERDPDRREGLSAILQASTRSAELTRKLLAFGRRGKNVVDSVDVNQLIRDSATMLRPSFRHNVTVEHRLQATWTIDGDPSQLSQLIVNLCINANEAMPGGGTLTLSSADLDAARVAATYAEVPAGEYVEIVVADTGVGIADDIRPHIFEPFFTTKVRGPEPGTGLGLATVDGVVNLHKGHVLVESAQGRGTTFTVLLPRGTAHPSDPATAADTRPGQGLILVVDDEPLLRLFATDALTRFGYTVVTAVDGEDGVRVFAERHREIAGVILDLKMPKKDGRAAFAEFQAINPRVPVLICSGYGDNEEAQALISMGARGLLGKPYRMDTLADLVAKLVAPARQ